jgi:ribosomal protein S18 acetylase RimI-like enzyme
MLIANGRNRLFCLHKIYHLIRKKLHPELEFKEVSFSYAGLSDFLKPSVGYPTPEKMKQVILSYAKFGQYLIGAFLNNELVGLVGLHLDGDFAAIRHIAVNERYRKQGIGKEMLKYVLNYFPILTLYAETDEEAYGFYQQCGWSCKELASQYGTRYRCYINKLAGT